MFCVVDAGAWGQWGVFQEGSQLDSIYLYTLERLACVPTPVRGNDGDVLALLNIYNIFFKIIYKVYYSLVIDT
ncbi:MAG: hypothetical protein KAT04_13895 [Methylococcales bacterium]|nr:hypothetical protein [Methylococcales bacterium]